jgi:ATP dependent DNA ligase domain
MPRFIEPMLARSGRIPDSNEWALEVKFDGMRAQLRWDGRTLCLRSRPGRNCTAEFPELRPIADALGARRVILDGELVCFVEDGHPNFERLRGRLRSHGRAAAIASQRAPATFLAFDLMHLDGCSALDQPYAARRELLAELELEGPAWRTPRHFIGQTEAVLVATAERGLEGVVAKRLDSPYKPGMRNGAWLKHKHRRSEDFLITAWAPAQPGRPESFFLARRLSDGGLEPAGSVSLGLSSEERGRVRAALEAAERPHRRRRQRVRPVEPAAVATVDFHGPARGPVRDAVLRSVELPLADPPQGDRSSASRGQSAAPGSEHSELPKRQGVPSAVPGWQLLGFGGNQGACSHHGGVRRTNEVLKRATMLLGVIAVTLGACLALPTGASASKRCGRVFVPSRETKAKVRVVRGRVACYGAHGARRLVRDAYTAIDSRHWDGRFHSGFLAGAIYWRIHRRWRCSIGLGASQVFCVRPGKEVDGSVRHDDDWYF